MGADKTLLVTRPEPDNEQTARLLIEAGFKVELLPVLSFKALEFELPKAEDFAAIAITSANTLRALEQKAAPGGFSNTPLFAVGEKTAERAKALGFANVMAAGGNLVSLAELIKSQMGASGALFYPAGRQLSGDLALLLAGHKISVKTVAVYEMEPLPELDQQQQSILTNGSIDAGLFYSRRSGETFIRLCAASHIDSARLPVLCLSQNVADVFRNAGFKQIHLASAPNQQAMIALALSFAPINSK